MKGRELKEFLEGLTEEQLEQEVLVDTEGRCFNSHIVEVQSAFYQEIEGLTKHIEIFLDLSATSHFRNK